MPGSVDAEAAAALRELEKAPTNYQDAEVEVAQGEPEKALKGDQEAEALAAEAALTELETAQTNYQSAEAAAALLIVRGNASQEKSQRVSPSGYVLSADRRTINLLAWLLACPDVGVMYPEAGGCAAGAVCSGRHLRSTARGVRESIEEGQSVPKISASFS